MVTVVSCGLAHGDPPAGDLMFDCRALPDPSEVVHARPGSDPEVAALISDWNPMVEPWVHLATGLVLKTAETDPDLVAVFYCSAGRHRSVFAAERVAVALDDTGVAVNLIHRDLEGVGK